MSIIDFNLSDLWGRALKNSSHFMIASLILKFLSFLVIPFLTREFSIEEFAIYDLFFTINSILILILGLGMDSGLAILLTEHSKNRTMQSFLLSLNLISCTAFASGLWVISLAIYFLFDIEGVDFEQWNILCAYTVFGLVSNIVVNFSRWIGKVRVAAYLDLVSTVSGISIGIGLVIFVEKDLTNYFYGLLLGAAFGALVSLYIVREYISLSLTIKRNPMVKDVYMLSLPFVPNYLGNNLMQIADRLLILGFLDAKALGIYALISRISLIPSVAINIISSGFLPVLYRNYRNQKGRQFIREVFHIYFFFVVVSLCAIWFLGEYLVLMFGGEKYGIWSYLLFAMTASVLINASTMLNGLGFTIERKTYQISIITYVALGINFVLSALLVTEFGLNGIIMGTLVAASIRAIVHTSCSERLHRFSYNLKLITLLIVGISIFSIFSMIYTL